MENETEYFFLYKSIQVFVYFRKKLVVIFGFLLIACSAQYQHRAVLENDALENLIPSHYRNPFLKTPRFLHALAKSSWFGPGEHPVK